ncbi:MAG: type II toxin-antitoxin system PemK/MazF family toxin [Chlamydiae bacterium]|nr:type II toxin-antitoxin system PemK/MazF family toxin [Chlamydiota bacterium]MBI3265544.1 type II toxin-antitoxin system PemK/MazF family toxin [Chlamydiota bacterium]
MTIQVTCMGRPAIAVIDQIRAVDKSRIVKLCDELHSQEMLSLEAALRAVLGL